MTFLKKRWYTVHEAVDYLAEHGVNVHFKTIHHHLTDTKPGRRAPKLRGKATYKGQQKIWLVSRRSLDAYVRYKHRPRVRPR